MPIRPEHLRSPPFFSEVRVTRSLVLCVCFGDRCLSFCTFSFGHCVVCSSLIYGFWLPLWYLQTFLTKTYVSTTPQNIVKCHNIYWPSSEQIPLSEQFSGHVDSSIIDRIGLSTPVVFVLFTTVNTSSRLASCRQALA